MRAALLILLGLLATPAPAQTPPAEAALAAHAALEQAGAALQAAQGARDRVQALTQTVQAYEAGLTAMRDGLRQAILRETALQHRLNAAEGDTARLLGVIQTIETAPPPLLILHPSGPLGSARAAMMLAEVTPGLEARASALRADLAELTTLRQLQQSATDTLEEGLAGVRKARSDLSQAIADRTDLPRRFVEDPVRTAILIDSVETLDGFASGLSQISARPIPPSAADVSTRKGGLELPVKGLLLYRAGEPDAAGIRRKGVLVATRPQALAVTPAAATVRYAGPLLNLGQVAILEPQADLLIVLAGLGALYAETGEVLPEGAPVGLMPGNNPETGANPSTSGDGAGTDRSETLYIEVREGGSPVNPESWFRTDKDG